MDLVMVNRTDSEQDDEATRHLPVIFGLRYLEEEEAEIHDVVGCLISTGGHTGTGCDDTDQLA
jgi:Ribosomally synthesized peptide in Herpetosiphon